MIKITLKKRLSKVTHATKTVEENKSPEKLVWYVDTDYHNYHNQSAETCQTIKNDLRHVLSAR